MNKHRRKRLKLANELVCEALEIVCEVEHEERDTLKAFARHVQVSKREIEIEWNANMLDRLGDRLAAASLDLEAFLD